MFVWLSLNETNKKIFCLNYCSWPTEKKKKAKTEDEKNEMNVHLWW